MNAAERDRDARIEAMRDLELLQLLVAHGAGDLTDAELGIFTNMLKWVTKGCMLSDKARALAEEVAKRITPFDASKAPRGKEVPTPPVLQNLPLKPPGRR